MLTISWSFLAYVACFPTVYCHKCFHKIHTATTERFHSCTIPTFVLTFYKKMQRISNTYVYLDFCFLPGHASILQAFSSLLGPLQALPPFLAGVTIVLVLSCTPFPQDLEHFDHSPQEDCLQSVACDFEVPMLLHMPHVFLQFSDTNAFVVFVPMLHNFALQNFSLSSHNSTKKCKGLVTTKYF